MSEKIRNVKKYSPKIELLKKHPNENSKMKNHNIKNKPGLKGRIKVRKENESAKVSNMKNKEKIEIQMNRVSRNCIKISKDLKNVSLETQKERAGRIE